MNAAASKKDPFKNIRLLKYLINSVCKYFFISQEYRKQFTLLLSQLLLLLLIFAAVCLYTDIFDFKEIPYYLPLHSLMETASIVVSMMVFAVGWRPSGHNFPGNVSLLACLFFFVGLLDFSHTASYLGMPDFVSPNDAQKQLNFWLAARLLGALALLVVSARPWRPRRFSASRYVLFLLLLVGVILLNWMVIFHQSWLPDTFIPGLGLTSFKKNFEYSIMIINIITAIILFSKMKNQNNFNVVPLFGAVVVMAMSEYMFTLYTTMVGAYNVFGHIYKVISYLFIYRAIVLQVIDEPYKALQASEERFRHIFELAPIGMVTNRLDGQFTLVNQAFCSMLGYRREDLESMTFYDVTHPEDKNLTDADRQKLITGEIVSYQREKRYLRKDNKVVVGVVTSSILETDQQGNVSFIAQVEDITARKQLEENLQRSSAEIAQFSQVLAHHLQEPVRLQLCFAERLKSLISEEGFSAEVRQALAFIVDGAAYSRNILRDVQLYLDLTRSCGGGRYCDAALAVRQAQDQLAAKILDAGALIVCGSLPPLFIDPDRLVELLVALLENSLTYRHPDVRPVITIRALEAKGGALLVLEDNGPGIPEKFRERVFNAFERLHPEQNQAGTGIGLALVRKILESYGGRVWIEGREAGGTRVLFSLPNTQELDHEM